MILVFVHGWSVTDTDTYGSLPEALQAMAPRSLELDIRHVYLSRYISFSDPVTVNDLARAFEAARLDTLEGLSFSCITHSTGGPVMRQWVDERIRERPMEQLPLRHLVMLAPANHGSALAQLGKSRISRMKFNLQGIEPGSGVLDWLELGSEGQWDLNTGWLHKDPAALGCYPFVLTGQSLDIHFYDYLNPYLVEPGSDGVIRACSANLNFRHVVLEQDMSKPVTSFDHGEEGGDVYRLTPQLDSVRTAPPSPFVLIEGASHSGKKMGIMGSVDTGNAASKPVVARILDCLQVDSQAAYAETARAFEGITADVHRQEKNHDDEGIDTYCMFVLRVTDDQGLAVNDFDMLLLWGDAYRPDVLPKGFCQDKQRNRVTPNCLTYYLNYTRMSRPGSRIGIRINARPCEGFVRYAPGEFRSDGLATSDILAPDTTTLVDVRLKRLVDRNAFRLARRGVDEGPFDDTEPSARYV